MTKVKVVNAQSIDGREYKKGEVAEFADGRARDLVAAGKAVPVPETPKAAPISKEAKNG
ncbi:hypothetical protein MUN78_10195 [Leucobacter allii]|uniref:Uncharacterized protein n=1 Tax=Leucobacter allii TaxID=2932247 RepID=A0ABY4FHF4_9MICO|nr:hypothetical protein [Leucobacter allii]UOQ56074.1 hypothetical protein MUN78_10195 [Leucobacter allii]